MKKLKKSRLLKIIFVCLISIFLFTNSVQAEVIPEVSGGGEIQNSQLAQGSFNMVQDFTRNTSMDFTNCWCSYDFDFYI